MSIFLNFLNGFCKSKNPINPFNKQNIKLDIKKPSEILNDFPRLLIMLHYLLFENQTKRFT